MSKLVSLALVGLATAGVTLATPSAGSAQVPVGVQVGVGPVAVTAGAYVAPPLYPAYPYPVYVRPRVRYQPVYPVAPSVVVRSGYGWAPYRHFHYHGRHR
jgi:hypothetical protein